MSVDKNYKSETNGHPDWGNGQIIYMYYIFLEVLEVLSFKCKKAMLADLSSLRRRQSKSPKNIELSLGSRLINVIDIEFRLEVFKIHYT